MAEVAPVVRGLLAVRGDDSVADPVRMILNFRTSEAVLNYVNGLDVGRYSQVGVVTPDHAIRTKMIPLVVSAPEAGLGDAFLEGAGEAVAQYVAAYRAYFARHDGVREPPKKALDPMPRVVLVPGLANQKHGRSGASGDPRANRISNVPHIYSWQRVGHREHAC